MRIVWVDDEGREREVEVVLHDPDATVSDLVRALAGEGDEDPRSSSLVADGRRLGPDWPLAESGLLTGATVRLSGEESGDHTLPPSVATVADAAVPLELAVVGGPDAGGVAPLTPGRHAVGRAAVGAEVLGSDTVSAHHLDAEVGRDGAVRVLDAGSRNGTWLHGEPLLDPTLIDATDVLRIGNTEVVIRPPERARAGPPGGDGDGHPGMYAWRGSTRALNRPPRPHPPAPLPPVEVPRPPAPPEPPTPLGLVSILAPLVLGGIMMATTRSPTYALILLLSPIVAVGQVLDGRRRRRRHVRREARRWASDLAALTDALAGLASHERHRSREAHPDLARLVLRAVGHDPRLWERRPADPDWLQLTVGSGSERWTPPVERTEARPHPDLQAVLEDASTVPRAPVVVDLSAGGVVGLVGPRPAALAVARGLLVQAVTLHGPADLVLLVATDHDRAPAWAWASWLPHAGADPASGDEANDRARQMLDEPRRPSGPTVLAVVDSRRLLTGRSAPVRRVLQGRAGPVAGVVVASDRDQLPASCTTVVTLHGPDGRARVERLDAGHDIADVLVAGIGEATAAVAARSLAALDDPELDDPHGRLPTIVPLLPLLLGEEGELSGPDLSRRWQRAGLDPPARAPIGVDADGTVEIDLDRDGPHALVAGTTGAGKSELLRTLVTGLAVSSPPELLSLVLIDFKGGSAFDRCAELPHVVGLVTDLDAHLAQRALRCLDAELRRRERVLRDAGASDLRALRALEGPPLARLVVVVDEFATLRAELPDFVESLVSIAQRGRSLGVHLVLATQRPSGAVSESIRANTNLRIALRVQDAADSRDVIDRDDAASLPRDRPGRALARMGPGEVVALQTALCSAHGDHDRGPLHLRWADGAPRAWAPDPPPQPAARPEHGAPSDLGLVVAATKGAARGRALPPSPWPPLLPTDLALADPAPAATTALPAWGAPGQLVAFTRADDPDGQRHVPSGWQPAEGNLLIAGLSGSGRSTALASLVLALLDDWPESQVQVIDMGAGSLAPLEGLPGVGTVVGARDRARQARLLGGLRREVEERLASGADEPPVVMVVDGISALVEEWDTPLRPELDHLGRTFTDGPSVGVHVVVAGARPSDLPAPLRSLVRQQLLLRPGDDMDLISAGLRPDELPTWRPGRGVELPERREVQVARPTPDLASAVARRRERATSDGRSRSEAPSVAALPRHPRLTEVASAPDESPLRLPVGPDADRLTPVSLVLHPGEHAVVLGPPRSGRSHALHALWRAALGGGWPVSVLARPRGPLAQLAVGTEPGDLPPELLSSPADRPHLILVDDIDRLDPEDEAMTALVAAPGVRIVAAGRPDALRGGWSPWRRELLTGRVGLLLQPDPDVDGDLLGVRLPRHPVSPLQPGQGYLCTDGWTTLVEVAGPDGP